MPRTPGDFKLYQASQYFIIYNVDVDYIIT